MSTDRPHLYYFPVSANAYRAKLVLNWLKVDFDEVIVNMADGSQKMAHYVSINPLGQLPALVHGDLTVWDSHAIALYACEQLGGDAGREIWPTKPAARAGIAKWTYFDANELHNGIGMARNSFTFGYACDGEAARRRGEAALYVMNDVLARQEWLELGRPTLADLTCYPLISVAEEARIDLTLYPNIVRWMERLEAFGLPPRPTLAAYRASMAKT